MFKLVQSAGKSIGGIMTSTIAGQPVKIYKTAPGGQESSQVSFQVLACHIQSKCCAPKYIMQKYNLFIW